MMRAETNALRDEIRSQFQSLTDAAETTRSKPDPELRERLAHAAPMPHPCRTHAAATMFSDANVTRPQA